ncbi:hypothetical protein BGZ61DRAFT_487839 [Ilyonectria robusta]|uniref:uncharacterized protein n=1 Tax=Ilyonectria robusta TaxID=1079257 RepID=UPI001E8E957B|nr:uncharacterized protein BGZ61DRAFT_487839 [Ilyonectria robusta]KAH8650468.1 hypothetical protein BGZ61DRAFT_487839 [Ilyonectria robusta]
MPLYLLELSRLSPGVLKQQMLPDYDMKMKSKTLFETFRGSARASILSKEYMGIASTASVILSMMPTYLFSSFVALSGAGVIGVKRDGNGWHLFSNRRGMPSPMKCKALEPVDDSRHDTVVVGRGWREFEDIRRGSEVYMALKGKENVALLRAKRNVRIQRRDLCHRWGTERPRYLGGWLQPKLLSIAEE